MKQLLLLTFICLCAASLTAQPTLTAATNSPVVGDGFFHNNCNTTGMSEGASGAGVTWDFSTLDITDSYAIRYMDCSATPFCDTFPGTNVAEDYDAGTYYSYYTSSPSSFTMLGYEGAGFNDVYPIPFKQMTYPVTYGTARFDTCTDALNLVPYVASNSLLYEYKDSFTCDAYGTLILPSGTYTNVLRIHQIDYAYKLAPTTGGPDENEYYSWYSPDFHDILLEFFYGYYMGRRLTAVVYTDRPATAGLSANPLPQGVTIAPNPATDHINISFSTAHAGTTSVTLTDITGRQVWAAADGQVKDGSNNIECTVSGFPAGIYLVQLNREEGRICRKIVVGQ